MSRTPKGNVPAEYQVPESFQQFDGSWGENARLALDTIAMQPTRGIPQWMLNIMQHSMIEEFAGAAPGEYRKDHRRVYLQFQHRIGTSMIDQYIPDNPLSMGDRGYDSGTQHGATTGLERIVCDGMLIDSPEAVAEHLEKIALPNLRKEIAAFNQPAADREIERLIEGEVAVQKEFGTNMLKVPYGGFFSFPGIRYGQYGYANYFMAYALYPEVMERDFSLQADLQTLWNGVRARAIVEGGLPRWLRLDHDMADSRGTLTDVRSLDRIWFPHFARSIRPLLDAGLRLLWHCDGNLMAMVPRLIEVGVGGFQGFQYEDGMDYEAICKMTDRDGGPLAIIAGVSVTRTLPYGTPADVKRKLAWLVKHGPRVGLMLGGSSSIAPGVPLENLHTFVDGLNHYRVHGRAN